MKKIKHILCAGFLVFATHAIQAQTKHPAPARQPAVAEGSELKKFSGKVTETMDASSYTYVLLDTGTGKLWAAIPQTQVKEGDTVAIGDGMPMLKYHSKILNRDFDVVYFAGDVMINGSRPTSPGADSGPLAGLPKDHPPINGSAAAPKIELTGIKKAKGGKTIEEVFAEKAKLSGHEITLRGKVVKFNEMILGRNWVHLRDGTGGAGNNDLLVTTTTPVKVGDTVVVTGKVALNRNFGSNYKYDLMLEDAKVVVE
jgi:hypothetical protein